MPEAAAVTTRMPLLQSPSAEGRWLAVAAETLSQGNERYGESEYETEHYTQAAIHEQAPLQCLSLFPDSCGRLAGRSGHVNNGLPGRFLCCAQVFRYLLGSITDRLMERGGDSGHHAFGEASFQRSRLLAKDGSRLACLAGCDPGFIDRAFGLLLQAVSVVNDFSNDGDQFVKLLRSRRVGVGYG